MRAGETWMGPGGTHHSWIPKHGRAKNDSLNSSLEFFAFRNRGFNLVIGLGVHVSLPRGMYLDHPIGVLAGDP